MDLYEVLGVSPDTDGAAIKRAYLAAARRHHPDFHVDADDAKRERNAAQMQVLNQAWEVLADADARAAYDRSRLVSSDPGVARRAAREAGNRDPEVPAGKGWTPRAGDDGWMNDFDGWANDRDELAPDAPRSTTRAAATLIPVGLFALAVVLGFLGLVLQARPMVAGAAICVALSLGTFVLLPMFEMARGRRR